MYSSAIALSTTSLQPLLNTVDAKIFSEYEAVAQQITLI